MKQWPVHASWSGPIVMIGFGSIGRGTLPLLLRHIKGDRSQYTIIDPLTSVASTSPTRKASPSSRRG